METLTPLTAIDPRRLAALMRLSHRARQDALAALTYATWWQRQRELLFSCTRLTQVLYNRLAPWIEEAGEPVYAGQKYLAKLCRCSLKSVSRGISELKAFGLIEQRRRRWQDQRGRWHEASSLYSLPAPPAAPEQAAAGLRGLLKAVEVALAHRKDKTDVQTPPKTRQIQKKEGLRSVFDQKQDPKGSWKRPGPILSRMFALGTVKMQR